MLSEAIIQYLNRFKRLGFAVSGGKDSMALLHAATKVLDKNKMLVVTINHNLRDEDGKKDKEFVLDYCETHGIPCKGYDIFVKDFCQEKGYTIEQGARVLRHNIFNELVAQNVVDRVLLAHHKDDQIESILMHIFRGSGLNGLCGMQLDTGVLVRPLLEVASKDIEQYVLENNIPYVQDYTNFQLDYTRNKVRNVLIKEIESIYPNFKENIVRLSNISTSAINFIKENAPKVLVDGDVVYLKIDHIKNRNILTDQAIIDAIERVHTRVNLEMTHINNIYELCNKENGKKIFLPFDTICQKEYDKLVFYKQKQQEDVVIDFKIGEHIFGDKKIIVSKEKGEGLFLDLDKATGAVIRYRQEKDVFKKFKGGTKSLGDYLTDIKVPNRQKACVPVIAKDKQILAVLPYEISDYVKIDNDTKNIVYVRIEKND